MMKFVFGFMIIAAVVFGISSGNIDGVSNAVLEEGVNAIELSLYMIGGMCVWGGILKIAEKAGITKMLSVLFKPIAKLLFKNLDFNGKAYKAISMNIIANILGLGNAATPFGLEAMKELEKEENLSDTASNNMVVFTVLNTASITLIPTTVAMLRLKHGSSYPLDVLPAILLNSLISLTVAIILTKIINSLRSKK